MAIVLVGSGSQIFADGSNTLTLTKASSTSGNLLIAVLGVSFESFATPLNTPAGWNLAVKRDLVGALAYAPGVGIYWQISTGVAPSAAFTIDNNGGSYAAGGIAEFSGMSATPSDVSATGSGTSTTSGNSGTTATTAQADELVIAVGHAEDAVGATSSFSSPASSGFTSLFATSSNAAHIAWDSSYKIVAAAGTQVGSWTWTTSSDFAGCIATFKASGGGGGGGGRTTWGRSALDGMSGEGIKQFNPSLSYHQHPMLSLEAYRREQARKHRDFMAKVRRAA